MTTKSAQSDLIWEFLFAYDISSIPYNLVMPGDPSKPAIQLPTAFASPDPILKALELARPSKLVGLND